MAVCAATGSIGLVRAIGRIPRMLSHITSVVSAMVLAMIEAYCRQTEIAQVDERGNRDGSSVNAVLAGFGS